MEAEKTTLKPDALVVGGGPIGSIAAFLLSREGLKVVVIEEHRKIGLPVHCAGLLGIKAWKALPIKPVESVKNEITSFKIYSPFGEKLEVNKGKTAAYVVDRAIFDSEIARSAEKTGAKFLLSTKLKHLDPADGKAMCQFRGRKKIIFKPKVLIGADGAFSIVSRQLNLFKSKKMYFGFQYYTERGDEQGTNEVKIFIDNVKNVNIFHWIIPSGSVVKIGSIFPGRENMEIVRRKLLKIASVNGYRIKYSSLWLVPSEPVESLVKGNVAVVGDAAGQNKPLSRGGIYFGVEAVKIMCKWVLKAIEEGNKDLLENYGREWRRKFMLKIRLSLIGRYVFEGLTHDEVRKIFRVLKRNENQLSGVWDLDEQEEILFFLARKAFFLPGLSLRFIKDYLKTIFH